jgi:hypothetical protein
MKSESLIYSVFLLFQDSFFLTTGKTTKFSKNDLSKVPPPTSLKSKKFLEKTLRPVFLCENVLKK